MRTVSEVNLPKVTLARHLSSDQSGSGNRTLGKRQVASLHVRQVEGLEQEEAERQMIVEINLVSRYAP